METFGVDLQAKVYRQTYGTGLLKWTWRRYRICMRIAAGFFEGKERKTQWFFNPKNCKLPVTFPQLIVLTSSHPSSSCLSPSETESRLPNQFNHIFKSNPLMSAICMIWWMWLIHLQTAKQRYKQPTGPSLSIANWISLHCHSNPFPQLRIVVVW